MGIAIDKDAERVRVNIAADLTAEELRELLGQLGKAHGELLGIQAPDTGVALFASGGLDVRPVGDLVQISLLAPCGWVQHGLTHGDAEVLIQLIRGACAGVPVGSLVS